jgi:hypothetical protein
MIKTLAAMVGFILISSSVPLHAELVHQFKSPSFNGQGWSSHVLTIDSIEKNRKDAIESQKKSDEARALSEAQNTPLSRFFNLFQGQVYAQLANQLTDSLFRNDCKNAQGTIPGCIAPTTGTFTLDGNTVTWNKTNSEVALTVVDAKGTITTMKVPIASFAF